MSSDAMDLAAALRAQFPGGKLGDEPELQPGEMTPEEAVGQLLPSQELLNRPEHVNHPAQYKRVGQSGPKLSIPGLTDDAPWEATRAIVTVQNVATGKVVDLDLRTEIGQRAWRDIRRCALGRRKAQEKMAKVGR